MDYQVKVKYINFNKLGPLDPETKNIQNRIDSIK